MSFVVWLAEDIDRDEVPMFCRGIENRLLDMGLMVNRVEFVEEHAQPVGPDGVQSNREDGSSGVPSNRVNDWKAMNEWKTCKWCHRTHPERIGCWYAWLMGDPARYRRGPRPT